MFLSAQAHELLLNIAPPHKAQTNSPETFEAVKSQALNKGFYVVFDGGSTDTIFKNRATQYAYRAWHDSLHIKYDLDFSKASELKIADIQEIEFFKVGGTTIDAELLKIDLKAHILYYYATNSHPIKQKELIALYKKYGYNKILELIKNGMRF